ncbi:MAG: hypothetical protein K2X47_00665 [Bdellovibrionales bacterium]|nr:hypothetical protein [Bdellovibrionales bacterium]
MKNSIRIFLTIGLFVVVMGFNNCKPLTEPENRITAVVNPPKVLAEKLVAGLCGKRSQCLIGDDLNRCQSALLESDVIAEQMSMPFLDVRTLSTSAKIESANGVQVNDTEAKRCLDSIEQSRCDTQVEGSPLFNASTFERSVKRAMEIGVLPCSDSYRASSNIFSIGGQGSSPFEAGVLSAVYSFDRGRRTWTAVGNLPKPRTHFSVVQGLGRTYVLGGLKDGIPTQEILSSADNLRWNVEGQLPRAMMDFSAVRFWNEFWMLGGASGLSMPQGQTSVVRTRDFKSFSSGPDLPQGLFGGSVYIHQGRLFVAGGASSNTQISNVVYRLKDDLSAWENVGTLPASRYGGLLVKFKERLYFVGGRDSTHTAQRTVYTSLDGLQWSSSTDYVGNQAYGSSWVENGFVYIFAYDSIYRSQDFSSWEAVGRSPTNGSMGAGFVGLLAN